MCRRTYFSAVGPARPTTKRRFSPLDRSLTDWRDRHGLLFSRSPTSASMNEETHRSLAAHQRAPPARADPSNRISQLRAPGVSDVGRCGAVNLRFAGGILTFVGDALAGTCFASLTAEPIWWRGEGVSEASLPDSSSADYTILGVQKIQWCSTNAWPPFGSCTMR